MARTGLGNPAFLLRACLESRTVPLACLSRGFQPHASQAVPRAGSPQADRLEACPTGPAGLFRPAAQRSVVRKRARTSRNLPIGSPPWALETAKRKKWAAGPFR